MSKNQEIAARVLKAVGGEGNVNSVVHCATRLRFKLKDENKADTAALNADPDVIQVVQSAGQYQVVIGSHVSDVYKDLMANSGLGNDSDNREKESGGNIFNRLIDIISSIFTPFLGAMAGAGVLKGFLTLAVTMGWLADTSGVYLVLFSIADGLFTFLPIMLAFTAAKKFNTNPFLAVALAMALVHPSITALAGKTISFAGLPVIIGPSGYTSSVLPIILAVFAQSYVERFFKKVIPSFLQIICVPLAVFLIMAPVTFLVIGPIGTVIGDWLGQGYNAIYAFSPIIAGLLMGSLWQVLVMFGMHWGFVPIMMLNLTQGGDTMVPMLLPAVIAQGGAALAVFFLTKNVKLKGLALSSSITTIFGITEPTVYGVTLPLKKPFIAACIGGGIGGAFVAMNHVKNFTFGLVSMLSLPGFIPAETNEEKQMAYFSIKVPTEKEFLQIAQRVLEQDYPIDESFQIGTRQSMFITDLEGNQFEIFHDEATANSTSEKQPIVLKDLISEDLEPHQELAAGSYLAHVQLKTNNQKEIKAYYEEVLGLKRNEKDQFVLEDGKATIGFQKPETSEVDQLPDPHLGLDFFTIKLSDQEHILAMEQQLTAKNQEFFIDQKKAIVTVFDPIGLEWWFVLK